MDFSKFDSRTAAETPIRMPIRAQSDGEPIFDGDKQCFVLVKGASSRSVQAKMRKHEIAQMKKGKRKDDDDPVDPQQYLSDVATCFVAGFENVQRPDGEGKLRDLTDSAKDCAWFFGLNRISGEHLLRAAGSGLDRNESETDEEFAARSEAFEAKWLKPSFSQQVIDCGKSDDDFLALTGKD